MILKYLAYKAVAIKVITTKQTIISTTLLRSSKNQFVQVTSYVDQANDSEDSLQIADIREISTEEGFNILNIKGPVSNIVTVPQTAVTSFTKINP